MTQTHVVIVGGGFAGLQCAIDLAPHKDVRVTLLDRNNYQQFQPLLYQVATSILSPSNAAFALRDILRDHSNVDVQMDEVVSIDLAKRSVRTASGTCSAPPVLSPPDGSADANAPVRAWRPLSSGRGSTLRANTRDRSSTAES